MSLINSKTKLNLILGHPVGHSLSPSLHNSLYKHYGLDSKFVFLAVDVLPSDLSDIINSVQKLPVNALTVTIPHKVEIIQYLDQLDVHSSLIGAVNTVIFKDSKSEGYNTDWLGTLIPLANFFDVEIADFNFIPQFLKGKKVALLGAGGASRAMAYAALKAGAEVCILNRTESKSEQIAVDFAKTFEGQISCGSLDNLKSLSDFCIIINSTSVGMGDQVDLTPLPKEFLSHKPLVMEAIYRPNLTRLLIEAKNFDCPIIKGDEMFVYQALYQFWYQTGIKPEVEVVRSILESISL
jgi:shikimate dehydrogenase